MEKVLEIQNLTKKFGKLTAVDDLSLSVVKGNIYGLLGPNGSGKSTTLGMILNVVNPTLGKWKWFEKEHSVDVLKKVGAIIERPNFYPYLSAEKNLEIIAQIKEVSYSKIDEKLKLVGLLERKKDKFQTFSLGMKQRLAIASAMLNDPYVLILDEPTNGLDPQGIIQIREIIQEIAANGTTIILASHLLDEVEKVCSHVVILQKGKTLYSGKVDEMIVSYGYFELNAENDNLISVLQDLDFFSDIKKEGKHIKATLSQDVKAEKLNSLLFEKGIILNHLVKRKESLEQQFLQITQN
ncbi:MAG: ATP-binding cassette domain-containing protein [Weeksellaceae bacterium]|jgi:ABC-2 type transport system ATP-binding protein|nr:ATP-binding cassette domain-containing protein [Weeksellaceae bacterium]